jgi:hypothetical protein
MGADLQEHAPLDAKDAKDGSSQLLSADPGACTACGEPLDPALIEGGYTTHGEDEPS